MQVLAECGASVGPGSECVGVLVLGDGWSNTISADTRRLITGELGVSSGDHASIQVSVTSDGSQSPLREPLHSS